LGKKSLSLINLRPSGAKELPHKIVLELIIP